jgi:hypothetical protein
MIARQRLPFPNKKAHVFENVGHHALPGLTGPRLAMPLLPNLIVYLLRVFLVRFLSGTISQHHQGQNPESPTEPKS